jgi:hypothetical protein
VKHFIKCGRHFIVPSRIMAVGPLDEKTLGASAVLVETGQAATLMHVQETPDAIAAKVEAARVEAEEKAEQRMKEARDAAIAEAAAMSKVMNRQEWEE